MRNEIDQPKEGCLKCYGRGYIGQVAAITVAKQLRSKYGGMKIDCPCLKRPKPLRPDRGPLTLDHLKALYPQ